MLSVECDRLLGCSLILGKSVSLRHIVMTVSQQKSLKLAAGLHTTSPTMCIFICVQDLNISWTHLLEHYSLALIVAKKNSQGIFKTP